MEDSPSPSGGPDLLTDCVFTVRPRSDIERYTLPGLLTRLLAGGEIGGFPELAAEQRGHVWRFLVRCAAKALREVGVSVQQARSRPCESLEPEVARVLAGAAPEGAWKLYQPDPAKPGFLQIPTPDGKSPSRSNNYSPRSMGLLTSVLGGKNHERKSDVSRELSLEQAVYALIEYQLSAVFGGRGNYETQLLGSRAGAGSGVPVMGARIGDSFTASFRHDVRVMLDGWAKATNDLHGTTWALWAERWDGKSQLASERLDPAFIPTARMIRLEPPRDGRFCGVQFRPTDAGRVRDHTGGGVLGDPLTPLVPDPKTGSPKVRGTLRKGYDYTEVVRLLFGSSEQGGTPSPSVRVLAFEGEDTRADLRVVFEGTAYEQGKTGGFHHREVLLPPGGANYLEDAVPVRIAHEQMLQRVKDVKGALRGSARILLNGELRPREGDASKTEIFAARMELRVDAAYLSHLWDAADAITRDEAGWIVPWTRWLSDQALDVFHGSLGMLPSTTGRRFEREISAENYLQYKLAQLRGEIAAAGAAETEVEPEPTEEEEQPA